MGMGCPYLIEIHYIYHFRSGWSTFHLEIRFWGHPRGPKFPSEMPVKRLKDSNGRYRPSSHLRQCRTASGWTLDKALSRIQERTRCSPCEDFRQFRAWVGVTPDVVEMIYQKYYHPVLLTRSRLLLVLNWLKTVTSQDEGSSSFQISRPTYRKYLWETIDYLDASMTEVNFNTKLKLIF